MGDKPIKVINGFPIGRIIISIDVELAWSRRKYNKRIMLKEDLSNIRGIIKQLLEIFSKYNINVTWGIVGHLFLKECMSINGIKHPDMPRPTTSNNLHDWYDIDPCGTLHTNPFFYGFDIVQMIQEYKHQHHEICSHSFSHVIFNDKSTTKDLAVAEYNKCQELARQYNININSFIYPENAVAYTELLLESNYKIYRGSKKQIITPFQKFISIILNYIHYIFQIPFDPVLPILHNNSLLEIPVSMSILSYKRKRSIRDIISIKSRFNIIKKGITKAINNKEIFHIWFHPSDFLYNTKNMIIYFDELCKYINELRQQNKIEIITMNDLLYLVQ